MRTQAEQLAQLGDVLLQDEFQVWEPKKKQPLLQLAQQLTRNKARDRRVFLFETCLLLAKEVRHKDKDAAAAARERERDARDSAASSSTSKPALKTKYTLKSQIFVRLCCTKNCTLNEYDEYFFLCLTVARKAY